MIVPIDKVKDIINKHDALEKELSSGHIDPKLFVKKSKEYLNWMPTYSFEAGVIEIIKQE